MVRSRENQRKLPSLAGLDRAAQLRLNDLQWRRWTRQERSFFVVCLGGRSQKQTTKSDGLRYQIFTATTRRRR